ncbi:MAG: GNAT family N-acetyltransferase [Armatimonadota bacterium]|nr:GNAT family N-acetyltransferase [Armatimonadota bacterium]MDR5702968.1 GNAT family N-acetyltransferase [Armatimonadota bacterium]MDR7435784.1 GNAT family N-acetyltransferase [Armatimonadota bacterium]
MGAIEIRRATSFDIPQIVPLWKELAAYHATLDPAFAISPEGGEAYVEYLHTLMRNREALVVVALDQRELVGYAVGRVSTLPRTFLVRRRGYIHDVFVRESYRLRGVGRQLIGELLQWFRGQGITLVELTVAIQNAQALAFWEKLGFTTYMVHMKLEV